MLAAEVRRRVEEREVGSQVECEHLALFSLRRSRYRCAIVKPDIGILIQVTCLRESASFIIFLCTLVFPDQSDQPLFLRGPSDMIA